MFLSVQLTCRVDIQKTRWFPSIHRYQERLEANRIRFFIITIFCCDCCTYSTNKKNCNNYFCNCNATKNGETIQTGEILLYSWIIRMVYIYIIFPIFLSARWFSSPGCLASLSPFWYFYFALGDKRIFTLLSSDDTLWIVARWWISYAESNKYVWSTFFVYNQLPYIHFT